MASQHVLLLLFTVNVALLAQAMIFIFTIVKDELHCGQRRRRITLRLRQRLVNGKYGAVPSWDDEESIYWVIKDADEA